MPVPGCARIPFDQRLEVIINLSLGVVEGRTRGRISTGDGPFDYHGEVRGNASCVPASGNSCGQLIVDLEVRGTLSDPTDPARVGLLRMEMLGSLLRGQGSAYWASLTSNASLGGDAGLISSLLDTMEASESCGGLISNACNGPSRSGCRSGMRIVGGLGNLHRGVCGKFPCLAQSILHVGGKVDEFA